mmetsp:Transcript_51195/g.128537  ORF Transcript_51195/g.128537 Transcript_51195/m.128537 type:complete len:93 (-) Transcript_51195:943-1221(-)
MHTHRQTDRQTHSSIHPSTCKTVSVPVLFAPCCLRPLCRHPPCSALVAQKGKIARIKQDLHTRAESLMYTHTKIHKASQLGISAGSMPAMHL